MRMELGNSTLKNKESPCNRKKQQGIERNLLYSIPRKNEEKFVKI